MLNRRTVLGAAGAALWAQARADDAAVTVRVRNGAAGAPVSPLIYGSNEIGTADGGSPSAALDRAAGVTARRFGGNFATTYNWTTNACNAGKDYAQANGDFLADLLDLPETERREPGAVIARMHQNSLAMGAVSLVTLPLAGFVAGDRAGPVRPDERAPSRRFVPVRWDGAAQAGAPVDPRVADIPHLLARLVARFGPASGATGIRGYILDNEPDLWAEQHPRIVRAPVRIADLLARALAAARAIKRIDPEAWVIGPASWGATGMASLQSAPDWPAYARHGSFLAAYLDAFRQASERDGRRLLDGLDVHWYPFSDRGALFRTEDPALSGPLLDAPRSLSEPGFREASWVSRALPVSDTAGLALPLLPSLERLVHAIAPGTRIAVTEYNYGGAGQLASGLALADALCRFARPDMLAATHWGSLDGWLGEAFRLHRNFDGHGGSLPDTVLPAEISRPDHVSARAADAPGRLHVVLINRSETLQPVDLVLERAVPAGRIATYGFDAAHPVVCALGPEEPAGSESVRIVLPPRSARHCVMRAA
ncbi:glycoside hydrolase family 44 protein [Methylobacterium sp. NEAU K]|uniref:glycoside hydrolase family 44 protein n=1 Tax=Methylobacterium sp. NEAU K TaxID=3064946 RepID=UPI002732802B|nr:glycoside hydrolase family 44 protein [Methylobacterium sp. NEAU K]MDP4006138.1 glycoside hydrolase family 44 protein [Methylobacterium sp. NEAU K]